MKKNDIVIGEKYGKLTILKETNPIKCTNGRGVSRMVLCKCDCGNTKIIRFSCVKSGHTKSCGCWQKKKASLTQTKHNMCEHKLYEVWKNMKRRCYGENSTEYKNYGGRGIAVCKEWRENFNSFYKWAIKNGWEEGLTLDRIDVNGNYKPDNCRIVSYDVQANNTTRNHYIEFNGKKYTLSTLSKHLLIPYNIVRYRISVCNYSVEQLISFYKNNYNEDY